MSKKIAGLAPVISEHSKVLILGSFPSVSSLREQQYYAHQRNQFWVIMQQIFGIDCNAAYAERCHALCQKNLAIWDVIRCCQREGSLDSNICQPEVNDFKTFYKHYPQIVAIFWNGKVAERLYVKHVNNSMLVGLGLPSTSPANTMHLSTKLNYWQAVHTAVL